MTTEKRTKELNLTIEKVGATEKGSTITVTVPWSKFPTELRIPQDAKHAKELLPGTTWAFVLKQGNKRKAQDGKEYDGSKDWHWWWDFDGVMPVSASSSSQPPATPPLDGTEQAPGSPKKQWAEFRTPEQMIRGQALECATALACALVAKGETMRSNEVMLVAGKYEHYLATGELPRMPVQAVAPLQTPAQAPASRESGKESQPRSLTKEEQKPAPKAKPVTWPPGEPDNVVDETQI